jgi:hypothetical protein
MEKLSQTQIIIIIGFIFLGVVIWSGLSKTEFAACMDAKEKVFSTYEWPLSETVKYKRAVDECSPFRKP